VQCQLLVAQCRQCQPSAPAIGGAVPAVGGTVPAVNDAAPAIGGPLVAQCQLLMVQRQPLAAQWQPMAPFKLTSPIGSVYSKPTCSIEVEDEHSESGSERLDGAKVETSSQTNGSTGMGRIGAWWSEIQKEARFGCRTQWKRTGCIGDDSWR